MRTFRILPTLFVSVLLVGAASAQQPVAPGPGLNAPRPGAPVAAEVPEPAQPAAPASADRPEIDIAEAAGTLLDPTAFIYLSKEYVFNLLVLASNLSIPGVNFDSSLLPAPPPPEDPYDTYSGSSGYDTGDVAAVPLEPEPVEVDRNEWMQAVSVSGNDEMSQVLELVSDLPEWQTVHRFPLPTTEKKKIDEAIAGIYALAINQVAPPQQSYNAGTYGGSAWNTYDQYDQYNQYPSYNPNAGPGGQTYDGGGDSDSGEGPSIYGQQQFQPSYAAAPPPVDPQTMGIWYHHYQQMIAWERYVSEEVLSLEPGQNDNKYDLDTVLGPQDLYLIPTPDGSTPMINFDKQETAMTPYLSVVRPGSLDTAKDQMERQMRDLAEEESKEDSDRSREYVARLDLRQERRWRYRQWLNDQATEIRKMAEDYRRRLAGERVQIEGMEILLTKEPIQHVPQNARNIVTEKLTPYDLLDEQGTLIRPPDETAEPML